MAKRKAATAVGKVDETAKVDAEVMNEPKLVSSPDQEPLNKRRRKESSLVKRKDVESSSKGPIDMPAMESPGKLPSPGLSSFKEPAEFLARARELLLVEDDSFLKGKKTEEVFDTGILGAFQVFESQLHLHRRYKGLADKNNSLRKANEKSKASVATLEKELAEIKQQVFAADERLKVLEKELGEEKRCRLEESTKVEATLAVKDAVIADLKNQVKTVAAKAMNRGQAELFREYLSGDHSKWAEEEMKDVIAMDDELTALEEAAKTAQTAEKGDGGNDTDMVEDAAAPTQDAGVSSDAAQDPLPQD